MQHRRGIDRSAPYSLRLKQPSLCPTVLLLLLAASAFPGSLALQKTVDLNDLGFTPFEPPGDVEYPFSYSESPTFQTYEACQDSPEPFNYLLPEIPGVNRSGDIRDASVVVTLYNADVDNGQHNDVYLNGLYLGTAGGRQDTYSRTIFKFRTPAEWAGVKFNGEGGNTIRVVNQDPYDAWFTCLSWVQLVVRINHAPYVVPDQHYPTNEDTPLFVDAPGILINATDVDGDAFSITSYTNTTYGTLALNNYTGAFNYTNLRPNWNGVDSFEFTVTDQIGRSTTTTVYIDVLPVDDPPYIDQNTTLIKNKNIHTPRNAFLVLPFFGLIPEGTRTNEMPQPWDGKKIFIEVDNDTLVYEFRLKPDPLTQGNAIVDPDTNAVVFTPVYGYEGNFSLSFRLTDDTPARLHTEELEYTIVVGGPPPLETPTIHNITLTADGCKNGKPQPVHLNSLDLTSGIRRIIKSKKQDIITYGAPSALSIEVAPVGGPWPNATAKPKAKCLLRLPKKLKPGAALFYTRNTCAPCSACLQELQFKCGNSYALRIQAIGNGKTYAASPYTEPLIFSPACDGAASSQCTK